MPNVKISQLPVGATPLSGTELVPIVQGGTTVSVPASAVGFTATPGYTAEDVANKTDDLTVNPTSTTEYPTVNAVTNYVNNAVAGLLNDRGNFTPDVASPGAYPTSANNGSGPGGAPYKGDIWFIDATGFIGIIPVVAGMSVRALVNNPGQTGSNWDLLDTISGLSPEQTTNKLSTGAQVIANQGSAIKYPSAKALVEFFQENPPTLQSIISSPYSNTDLLGAKNYQGTQAGASNTGQSVNLFGSNSGNTNAGNNVNGLGEESAWFNAGNNVNAFGAQSAYNNAGASVNALGLSAANGNTNANINALGNSAAKNNTGSDNNALGYRAAIDNTGDNVNAIGRNAANGNTNDNVNAFGNQAAKDNTNVHVNAFGINAGLSNTFRNVNLFGPSASADGNGQLVWVNETQQNMRFDANGINADRKLTMPDADGTVVITVNGNGPDPSGNINITPPTPTNNLPYLVYAAYLQFSPGAITATQLFNTIGDGSGDGINDIAWNYGIGGWYQANMSAGPFTTKSAVIPSGYIGNGQYFAITGARVSSSQMNLFGVRPSDNSIYATAYVSGVYVEIRVYP